MLLEERLYECVENEEAYQKGTIICGFRRSRNLGETIAPTRPRRERRVTGEVFPVKPPGPVSCTSLVPCRLSVV